MTPVEITTKLMTDLKVSRSFAGNLTTLVHDSLKHKTKRFLTLGMRMTKDERSGKWGDDSTCDLYADIVEAFPIIATFED